MRDSFREREAELKVTCWGTRGSIAVPGLDTVRYGGNTSCIEVRAGGRLLIFDAGTGIRELGQQLARSGERVQADLFLTHYHWDHIEGFLFFEPAFHAETYLRVHGPATSGTDLRAKLFQPMTSIYFPVPPDALATKLAFAPVGERARVDADVEVAALPVYHPQGAVGYRVQYGRSTLAYIPDNELSSESGMGGDAYRGLVEFIRDADLLYHDATYTEAEYASRRGWGHSTIDQAVRLAEDACVRRLGLFHHAPERKDAELLEILARVQADLERRGSALEVHAAMEGEERTVP